MVGIPTECFCMWGKEEKGGPFRIRNVFSAWGGGGEPTQSPAGSTATMQANLPFFFLCCLVKEQKASVCTWQLLSVFKQQNNKTNYKSKTSFPTQGICNIRGIQGKHRSKTMKPSHVARQANPPTTFLNLLVEKKFIPKSQSHHVGRSAHRWRTSSIPFSRDWERMKSVLTPRRNSSGHVTRGHGAFPRLA